MDNNAFKDLVRSYGQDNAGSSSKAIARKAVEEEFRKKKRKRSGDADSSSDEDDDDDEYNKKSKLKQQEQDEDEEDDVEAIQKDLASRYRDRAKERREGKVGDTTTTNENTTEGSNNFLIVPHNINGLDLELIRKERLSLQSKSGGGIQKSSTTAADTMGTTTDNKDQDERKIRDTMPSLKEAHEILQAFLSRDKEKMASNADFDEYDFPTTLSSGIVEYLGELFNWKTLDVSTWDEEPTGSGAAARKSLQHTKFSLAIDGHPSDSLKAWQIPRQYTLSRGGGASGGSSQALLPIELIHKIDTVFRKKNAIRDEMMERQTVKSDQGRTKTFDKKETQIVAEKTDSLGDDDDESDDDMFGGLDD